MATCRDRIRNKTKRKSVGGSPADGRGIDDEVVLPVHGNFDAAPLPLSARAGGQLRVLIVVLIAGELADGDARRDGHGRDGRRRHVRRRLRHREQRAERVDVEEEAAAVVRRQPVAQRRQTVAPHHRVLVLRFRPNPRLQ